MLTQTLQVMVANLRSEAGHSTNVAQGLNSEATLKYLLARTQEELWTAFIWPELKVRGMVPLVAGQYTYAYLSTTAFGTIREMWALSSPNGSSFVPVTHGFPSEDMILPGFTNSERSDPVQYWEHEDNTAPDGHFRVWPTPNKAGLSLRLVGQGDLAPFVANTDRCTLDATCILLFAAAELLARSKAEDAANKLQKAQRHLVKLLGAQVSAKNKISTVGSRSPGVAGNYVGRTQILGYP